MWKALTAASWMAVLAACGGGSGGESPLASKLAAPLRLSAAATPLQPSLLFDWAEYFFASYFPPGPQDSTLPPYTYRGYATGNYLGVADGDVWLLGPVSGGSIAKVGSLSGFDCLAEPARCGSQEIAVPNAAAAYSYPLDLRLSGATYSDDAGRCVHSPSVIKFPASYMGPRRLPRLDTGPLASNVQRAVILKDAWDSTNISFESGCAGSARDAFAITLERLKAIKADRVGVLPWTLVDTRQSAWRIMNPAELNTSTMRDEDLAWVTKQAHAAGLKVQWNNQIQGAYDYSRPAASTTNIDNFMSAYEAYLLERGAAAQGLGIDSMMIGLGTSLFPMWQDAVRTQVEARLAVAASKLRTVYQGKIVYDQLRTDSPVALRAAVDENLILLHPAWVQLTAGEKANLSVPLLKSKILDAFNGAATQLDTTKPQLVSIHFGSRGDLFETGYLEETFCTSGYNVLLGSQSACIQQQTPTDFGLQAMLHEAALEAVAAQTRFTLSGVQVEYWLTDRVAPGTTFPNLAVSVRNKPAEAVVKHWFARP